MSKLMNGLGALDNALSLIKRAKQQNDWVAQIIKIMKTEQKAATDLAIKNAIAAYIAQVELTFPKIAKLSDLATLAYKSELKKSYENEILSKK